MARALVFPGQGSQAVGMGKAIADAFPAARETFEEVDDAIGQRLSRLMWEGPMEELTLTMNAQPALMAHSIAMLRVLEKEAGLRVSDARFVAGHSLGEYSALCAARALGVAEAARLLRTRGQAMQEAAPPGAGAMAALLGADLDAAQAAIDAAPGKGICEIANDNAPGQIVISGEKARVEAASESAKSFGFKMAKLLPVSAPFHSSLMAPAARRMREALETAELGAPSPPLIANVTACEAAPEDIRDLLVQQVTGRVRWRESIALMADEGCDAFVEIGPGKVLAGLIKRIAPDAKAISLGEPADVEAFVRF